MSESSLWRHDTTERKLQASEGPRAQSVKVLLPPIPIVLTDVHHGSGAAPPVSLRDASPSSSQEFPPMASLSTKLFNVVPPSTTFELRSSSSNPTRRNSTTPQTTPAMASSRPRGLIRRDVDARQDDLVRRFREAAKTAGRKVLGSLWVGKARLPGKSRPATPRSHLHRDQDVVSSSRLRPSLFRGVGRVGQVVVLLLFFLGMWEILGSQDVRDQQGIEGRPVRIRGRDPFSVLQDLQPRASKLYSTSIPSLDSTWRTDLARPGGMDLSGEGANGDVTAVLLHWKRTDNLKVIVAALCRYEFIDSILIWNNNPDIALTRAVSHSLSVARLSLRACS